MIRSDRSDSSGGGTAIAVRKSIEFSSIRPKTIVTSFEFTAILLILANNTKIIVASIYRSRKALIVQELSSLYREFKFLAAKVVLGGDYNAHSTDWACKKTNTEGRKLKDFCDQNNLKVFRTRNPSRHSTTGFSFIDLIITESNTQIIGSKLLHSVPFESDHDCVIFEMKLKAAYTQKHINTFRDWNNANIPNIRKEVNEFVKNWDVKIHTNMNQEEIDQAIGEMTVELNACIIRHVPGRSPTGKTFTNLNPLTKKCINERYEMRKHLHKAKRKFYSGKIPKSALIPIHASIARISTLIEHS